MLKGEAAEQFVEVFLRRFMEHGFGALPKREVDILVFHLLRRAGRIDGRSNFDIANELRVPEARVKMLRLESSLKYAPVNPKAVIGSVVLRLLDGNEKIDFSGRRVSISLEDPNEKRVFENAVKSAGFAVEYGNNRELLMVPPQCLLQVVVENVEHGEKEFGRLIRETVKDRKIQERLLDRSRPIVERLKSAGEAAPLIEAIPVILKWGADILAAVV